MKILVVEDEKDIRELLTLHLKRSGFEVHAFPQADEIQEKIEKEKFQLAIVDWMLPGISGLELIRQIRRQKKSHELGILMLTAKGEPSDVILGLEVGADDYLVKPFDVQVLLARVRALQRRLELQSAPAPKEYKLRELTVQPDSHEAFLAGEKIHLTRSEFKLLLALVQNQGKVLSRDQLMELIQGEGVTTVDRVIDTHIFGLRKKIGTASDSIETVRGVGYRVKPES